MGHIDRGWLEEIHEMLQNPPHDLEREALKKYYIDIDHHLHTKILESCSNRYLKTIMRNVYDHDQRIRMRTSDPLRDQNSTIREHLHIIEGLLEQDADKVRHWSLIHIGTSKQVTYEQMG